MDTYTILTLVLAIGAIVSVSWGVIGVVRHWRSEKGTRELKEPSTGAKTHRKLVRKLKEM